MTVLQRIAGGDRSAVRECIDAYSGLVWSLANRMLPDPADAEEVVQDVFMELWRHADRYDGGRASEATFIAMITRRRLIDRLRRSEREPARDEQFDLDATPAAHVAGPETTTEVHRVLAVIDDLPPEQRQVLRLSTLTGLSHGAIAERTGLPLGTVKSHLRRGLLAVRDTLGSALHHSQGRNDGKGSPGQDGRT